MTSEQAERVGWWIGYVVGVITARRRALLVVLALGVVALWVFA